MKAAKAAAGRSLFHAFVASVRRDSLCERRPRVAPCVVRGRRSPSLRPFVERIVEQLGDDAAQPRDARIVMELAMPMLLQIEARQRQRRLDERDRRMLGRIRIADRMRHRRDQVGAAQDERQAHEMRCLEHRPAREAPLHQILLEHLLAAAFRSHHRVAAREKPLERERPLGERVAAPQQADEAVREKPLLEEVRAAEIRKVADREIDAAVLERVRDFRVRQRCRAQVRMRRVLRERLQQPRQEHDFADVGQRDRERARALRRVELVRCAETALDARERVARGRNQGERARRRLHAARGPHEQRIAEVLAQPPERRAHTRLAHAEQLARAAHVARLVERDQIRNQVQIEVRHHVTTIGYPYTTYLLNCIAA
ncbi:hypothetical protein DP43_3671 [Burkholderia pseudomallei]|nr:hypothetical protein DP43_3671 [Burkholderia pseudomallei]